jgi:Tfp pilus assembly protein PilO
MNLQTQKYSQDLRRYYRLPATQISLTLVLSLFVMSIFIVAALRPTLMSITTLKKTISESEATLKKLDTKVENLQKISVQLEAIKSFLPTLNTNIPTSGAKYAPLNSAVESLAFQTGAKLDSESIGPTLLFSRILTPFAPNKHQGVVALPFSVRVTGSYSQVFDFLTKLLRMERIISTESISIVKEASSKGEVMLVGLSINGEAYYLADEAQLEKSMAQPKGTK